ncbi:transcriptional regulator ATRX homolog isoform X2 [Orussus abietinus]|uniref:transcriptional regulator ATRX homolog isoform X2 n=1 Tax=Orussus abietinus TaxID=222816 RepID=UPI0006255C4A|nr:transcriptional regulator ATRX homolog isoform X2 [Orussus abietinus]
MDSDNCNVHGKMSSTDAAKKSNKSRAKNDSKARPMSRNREDDVIAESDEIQVGNRRSMLRKRSSAVSRVRTEGDSNSSSESETGKSEKRVSNVKTYRDGKHGEKKDERSGGSKTRAARESYSSDSEVEVFQNASRNSNARRSRNRTLSESRTSKRIGKSAQHNDSESSSNAESYKSTQSMAKFNGKAQLATSSKGSKEYRRSSMRDKVPKKLSDIESKSDTESTDEDKECTAKQSRTSSLKQGKRGKMESAKVGSSQISDKKRHETDSSSGKEFQDSKLVRKSYVKLKQLCNIDEDYTLTIKSEDRSRNTSPTQSEGRRDFTKRQGMSLKSNTDKFLQRLKDICAKTVIEAEISRRRYCSKEIIHTDDAVTTMVNSENLVNTTFSQVETLKNELEKFYADWHRKCKISNIPSQRSNVSDVDNLTDVTKSNTRELDNMKDDESSKDETFNKKSSSSKNEVNDDKGIEVSDCDSEEIFSGSEMRTSNVNKSLCKEKDEIVEGETQKRRNSSMQRLSDESDDVILNIEEQKNEKNNSKNCRKSADRNSDTAERKESTKEVPSVEEEICDSQNSENEATLVLPKAAKSGATVEKNNSLIRTPVIEKNKDAVAVKDENSQKRCKESDDETFGGIDGLIVDDSSSDMFDSSINAVEDTDEIKSTRGKSSKVAEMRTDRDTVLKSSKDQSEASGSLSKTEASCDNLGNDLNSTVDNNKIVASKEDDNKGNKAVPPCEENTRMEEEANPCKSKSDDSENEELVLHGNTESAISKDVAKQIENDSANETKDPKEVEDGTVTPVSTPVVKLQEEIVAKNEEKKNEKPLRQGMTKHGSSDSFSDNSILGNIEETPELTESDDVEQLAKNALLNSNSEDDSGSLDTSNGSKSNSSKSNEGSDREKANLRAKKSLFISSTSDDSPSDPDNNPDKSNKKDSDNSNTSNSKPHSLKRGRELDYDSSSHKKKKFKLQKNQHYLTDEKLRMTCKVVLKRLKPKVLARFSAVLEQSKLRLEYKQIESLVTLESLEKKKSKKGSINDSNSDDEVLSKSSKDTPAKKKKRDSETPEESLLDHLKKVENEGIPDDSVESETEKERINVKGEPHDTSTDLAVEADKLAKQFLLNSSDSQDEGGNPEGSSSEGPKKSEKTKQRKSVNFSENKPDRSSSSSKDDEDNAKSDKGRWKRSKLLTMKLSDSDSEAEKQRWTASQEKLKEKKEDEKSGDEDEQERKIKKKRVKRRVFESDSDIKLTDESSEDSDSSKEKSDGKEKEKEKKRKPRKRGTAKSSDSDSLSGETKTKPKRRRIKKMDSDSDSDNDGLTNSQGTPNKAGRKNIRKVLKDNKVADVTKQAAKEEEERLKRIADRQKLYNEMYEMRLAGEERVDKLVLDFDEETKEEIISVHAELVKRLKPHQAQGIKFMWDACFESVKRLKDSTGSGCILAHCMGLGKSFQVVTLTHTLLTHEQTQIKTVMVVCPLNTVLNWVNEFKIWLEHVNGGDDINVFELTKMKKNFERKYELENWQRCGGVLIIGYEMFRNLSSSGKKMRKSMQESILKCLVDPGADLVICDEGHLLKNEDTALSKAMNKVKTLRRIVLTGTPLQNNLKEYHCMVHFVKPNLLGTKKEFMNRFVNPITNGQFDDSNEYDVKLMKKRAHVLHKMLEGSVQRFDYSVLMPFLPPKQEYVIFVRLTEVQVEMYQYYLNNLARRQRVAGGSLFADFQELQRVWTHPIVLKLNAEKVERANEKKRLEASDSEGSLRDFIDDGDDSDTSSTSSGSAGSKSNDDVQLIDSEGEKKTRKRSTRANPALEPEPEPEENREEPSEWWSQFVQQKHFDDIRISSKLTLLFGILKECEQIGDKVLVFSQSLYSLTLIEEFLRRIDDETQNDVKSELLEGHTGSWSLGLDYFRLDGQTSADNRSIWCNIFNKPSNTRARLFLISTRAGGLGINLTAANRVIIFDASWNPSHDVQSIFRIYRFGQKKPCYIYRFLAHGTMEEKIYNRQVTKLSLSCRVVDEQQIERHYSNNDLTELYQFEPNTDKDKQTLNLPRDRLLAEILLKYKDAVDNYHEHDSLLENKAEEELDEEERKQAWLEYEEEKKGRVPTMNAHMNFQNQMNWQQQQLQTGVIDPNKILLDVENIQRLIKKDYPNATDVQLKAMATHAVMEMYTYVEKQTMMNRNPVMTNPMYAPRAPNNALAAMNPLAQQQYAVQQQRTLLRVLQQQQQQQQQFHHQQQQQQLQQENYNTYNNNSNWIAGDIVRGSKDDDIIEITPATDRVTSTTEPQASTSSKNSKPQEE